MSFKTKLTPVMVITMNMISFNCGDLSCEMLNMLFQSINSESKTYSTTRTSMALPKI